jgi:translation initiation factor IF-1
MGKKVKFRGVVEESLGYGKFSVRLLHLHEDEEGGAPDVDGLVTQGYISGKLRKHHITVLLGDEVDIEVYLPEAKNGRIVYRYKAHQKVS